MPQPALLAARRSGAGWENLLEGQVTLLHYCEHVEADLRDGYGLFLNTLHVVTADKRVSDKELRRLLGTAERSGRPRRDLRLRPELRDR